MAARLEPRWLGAVELDGLDGIVRPDGNLKDFLGVPVVVTERKTIGAVGVLIPALIGGGHSSP
jgi:hypothetical protein